MFLFLVVWPSQCGHSAVRYQLKKSKNYLPVTNRTKAQRRRIKYTYGLNQTSVETLLSECSSQTMAQGLAAVTP